MWTRDVARLAPHGRHHRLQEGFDVAVGSEVAAHRAVVQGWGRGLGRVTVRFEGPSTPPGPVRTLAADDPALSASDPPDWRPLWNEEPPAGMLPG